MYSLLTISISWAVVHEAETNEHQDDGSPCNLAKELQPWNTFPMHRGECQDYRSTYDEHKPCQRIKDSIIVHNILCITTYVCFWDIFAFFFCMLNEGQIVYL